MVPGILVKASQPNMFVGQHIFFVEINIMPPVLWLSLIQLLLELPIYQVPDDVHLVIVIMSMEKRLLSKDHTGQHTAKTPHIKTVVIHLEW